MSTLFHFVYFHESHVLNRSVLFLVSWGCLKSIGYLKHGARFWANGYLLVFLVLEESLTIDTLTIPRTLI